MVSAPRALTGEALRCRFGDAGEGEADDGEVVMGSAAMFDLVIGRMVRGPAFSQLPADKQAAAAEQIAALKALFVKAQQQPSWTTHQSGT